MHKAKILIVEDETITAMAIESNLQNLGYEVTAITDTGKKAVEKVEVDLPDLVLMDIQIKGEMDGIEAAEVIQSRFNIPIIFATANLDEENFERAKTTMPFGYILKPIQKRELKVAIEMALFAAKADSERRKTEKLLQKSEQKYRQLIDNSPDLIYSTDQTGKIIFVSQSVKTLSGYTDEEAIGMDMAEEVYLHSHDRDRFLSEIAKKGFVHNFQAELKRKDGSTWWASTNAHIVKDADGNFAGVEGFTRDITETKKTEEALRESEEKFRLVATQSLMGVILSQDGFYQYVNEKVAQIFEYTVDELMGWGKENWSKLVHPDDVDFVMKQAGKKQAGEKDVISHYTYRGISRSGKIKWIELYSASVNYQGKTADLVTLIDRTERKEAEDALRDSEEKYRKVVMNAVEAICVIQDVKFKYFNPEAIRLFGYSEEELWQMSADDVVYPDDQKHVKERRLQREKGEQPEGNYSHRIVAKDDNIRWVDIKSVTITWNNRPAVLVFLTDITEKKQSQELMIQTEKMMSVGGLAAGMAHELNNPLGGMLQGVQNIQRRFSPDLESNHEPARESGIDLYNLQSYMEKRGINSFMEGIQNSGKKASQIISNMLQFSRKSESQMASIDLVKLVENSLELAGKDYDLKKKVDFRNIEIIKEFDTDLPLVPCTETEIEQVFLNLLGNATYAMANSNQTGLHRIAIRLSVDQNVARIEIEDNGPGMDERVRKRIFEPFYTTKPVGEGTGLGLSVSYMIITNNHNGTMEVESELGHGTKFIIQLPLEGKMS